MEADAVLFDLDLTLVDSGPATTRSWTRWAVEYRISAERFAAVRAHGRPSRELVAELVPAERVGAASRRIDELELSDTGDVIAMPGARDLLDALGEGRWAVVTSCTRALAAARMKAAGIAAATVVTADDVTRGKPDPQPFLIGARRLGVPADGCVVVEDAPAGLAAARAAGMRTVAVTTTHRRADLDADLVVDALAELTATRTGDVFTLTTSG